MVDIIYGSRMKVFGNRENLEIFKSDMAGDWENGLLSFQNLIPEPKDTSEWEGENEYWSGSNIWKYENWGCPYDAIYPVVKDEGEYLFYIFDTRWGMPIPIYELLVDRYSALNFEIHIEEIIDSNIDDTVEYELAYKKGKLVKEICMYKSYVPWRNNQAKELHYKEDLLKKTLQVIKEEVFDAPETKVLPATADNADSKDQPVAIDDIYSNDDDLLRELDIM